MPPGAYGELFDLLPIDAGALVLGLASGLFAARIIATRRWRFTLGGLAGLVALAATLFLLVARQPGHWKNTAWLLGVAALVMAFVDVTASRTVDFLRPAGRFPGRPRDFGIIQPLLGAALSVGVTLLVLRWQFEIPLRAEDLPSVSSRLVGAVLLLGWTDLTARTAAAAIRDRRRPGPDEDRHSP